MVIGQSMSLLDGNLGGTIDSHCNCVDHRRCPLPILQLVGQAESGNYQYTQSNYHRLISVICTVAIACSLGEIASIYPTAGGR